LCKSQDVVRSVHIDSLNIGVCFVLEKERDQKKGWRERERERDNVSERDSVRELKEYI